ncbi:hypothetical protein LTR64_007796 [Lithohypha guttulata]|uniref:uncharacterized protein n=1 Tax=Lithohypha guttulata TaxID=1690604 RepID=UPI002DDEE7CD|nr:hypothetical protein LTR51_007308 [Lithohypha guttulata]
MTDESNRDFERLLEFCSKKAIVIHPSIKPRKVYGAGLGVYTIDRVRAGAHLVQVPTKHVFTPDSIPESFIPNSLRKDLAVHAQLAAFFAFASKDDLEQYRPWLDTWPALHDFIDTMPIFYGEWAEYILLQLGRTKDEIHPRQNAKKRTSKRRKITLSGTFTIPPAHPTGSGLLAKMTDKLVQHIKSVNKIMSHLNLIQDDLKLTNFLHAWCLVNTRCFYYFSPATSTLSKKSKLKSKPPSDPNEAMALCPFMDLFNHRAPPPSIDVFGSHTETSTSQALPCKVKSTAAGFTVTTTSSTLADTEVLLSYGAHTNDTLWSEYGFLLPSATNTSDSICLDEIVLESMTSLDRTTLEEHGYLKNYILHNDGSICYRTEMASWLLVLGRQKWAKVVAEGLDPEDSCTTPNGKERHEEYLHKWLNKVTHAAEQNIKVLNQLAEEKLLQSFKTMSIVASSYPESDEDSLRLARQRRDMCLLRWEQIKSMASRGINKFKEENNQIRI